MFRGRCIRVKTGWRSSVRGAQDRRELTTERGLLHSSPPALGRVPWILVDASGPDGDRQGGGGAGGGPIGDDDNAAGRRSGRRSAPPKIHATSPNGFCRAGLAPGQPSFVRDFAGIWQAAEKIVFSRRLVSVSGARTRIERNFDPSLVRRLKSVTGHDMTVGGADLAGRAIKAQGGVPATWRCASNPGHVGRAGRARGREGYRWQEAKPQGRQQ